MSKTPLHEAARHARADTPALHRALRDARLAQGLTQQALAHKLGIRQRQISDLERAAMDPRLSTIQDVARALDMDLVLVPRRLIGIVEALQRPSAGSNEPMYSLDADDGDDDGSAPTVKPW